MCKLNNLLTAVQVKYSHSPSSESNHEQSGDAPMMLTRAQSRRQHQGFPLSPKQTAVNLRDDRSEQFSPRAMESDRPLVQHSAPPMAAAKHPGNPQHWGLSANNLVHVGQASPVATKSAPESTERRSCVPSQTHCHGKVQGSRERDWSVFGSTAKQHSCQSVTGSCNLKASQAKQHTSQLLHSAHLDPSGSGSNVESSVGKHTGTASSGNNNLDTGRCIPSQMSPTGGVNQRSSTQARPRGARPRGARPRGARPPQIHNALPAKSPLRSPQQAEIGCAASGAVEE